MPTDATFRLSIYLTLAFACAALGYAEYDLLPEVAFIAGIVFIALVVLYRLETRVELLSIPAANRLGLVLGLANFVWAAFRILRELRDPQLPITDWALLGIALIGPLVMTLMPAKLARREKHAGDYWWLHGLALATAALAGAMADGPIAVILIGLYAACAVWSLSIFYLRCKSGSVLPVPGQTQVVGTIEVVSQEQPRVGLGRALAFVAIAALVTGPMYLMTPRSTLQKLELGKPRVEIGYAADQMIDLTQTGDLRANQQIAFEVMAEGDAGPKTDLSPDQRWRGRTMRRYQSGVWQPGELRLPGIESSDNSLPPELRIPRNGREWTPPRLGPGQFTLTFSLPAGSRGRFVADPITWAPNEPAPIASLSNSGHRPWIWAGDGSFLSEQRLPVSMAIDPLRHIQVWRAGDDPDLSPPFRIVEPDRETILRPLRQNPVPKVKEYADGLIQRFVRQGKLPADHLDRITLLPRPEFHDRIAQSFTTYLATSPEFTYTTELRREKKDIDPIEEFLFHTHAGHCERFATALTLMLRSQGIPAILVLGFKGCEQTEEPGKYIVRQEHAHAWVEALIEQYEPSLDRRVRPISRWRSLDPTPGGEPAGAAGTSGWASRAGSWIRAFLDTYITDYTAEQRQRALAMLAKWITQAEVLGTGAAIVAMLIGARYLLRRRRLVTTFSSHKSQWFDRLLVLLATYGFVPAISETPREFAANVSDTLRQFPGTAVVAEVPFDWVEAYYESRFGGQQLNPDRLATLDVRLHELRLALAAR